MADETKTDTTPATPAPETQTPPAPETQAPPVAPAPAPVEERPLFQHQISHAQYIEGLKAELKIATTPAHRKAVKAELEANLAEFVEETA